jgi:hypothetical protein
MNVYVCEFKGGYCGGLVVVAANSADEAYRIVKNDNYLCLSYSCVDDIENEDYWDEEFHCYHRKEFRLLKGVTADVKTPQILAENHYEE